MLQFEPLLHAKPCSVRVFPQPCSTGDGRRLDTLFLKASFIIRHGLRIVKKNRLHTALSEGIAVRGQ